MSQATERVEQLGQSEQENPHSQKEKEIERLHRKDFIKLQQGSLLDHWLESKLKSGQPCRIVGESRTGKTIACLDYRKNHEPT